MDAVLQETEQEKDVEGLDSGPSADLGRADYPIDSVLIRPESRTIFEVLRRIKNNQYILDPDFQRDFVWPPEKQSRLIESILMRIPLPVFYLAEQPDGRVVVVDGLQRLTTFSHYFDNKFALKGTDAGEVLDGKKFKDLPPKFQSRLEDASLILYVIDPKVPERAKLDIFERVNSGVALSRQQMRNSLYSGPGTRWLKEQAQHADFLLATDKSINDKTMRDREVINRFCGFYLLGVEAYYKKADMDEFLANTLDHMNKLPEAELQLLAAKFQQSMRNNYLLFGKQAFRKILESNKRSVINVGLFDVFSVFFAHHDEAWVKQRITPIRKSYADLLSNAEFQAAITSATNSIRRVKFRFEAVAETLGRL